MKNIKKKCEDDVKLSNEYIKQVEMKVANISQEMKKFAVRVEKKLNCPLFKKVENGLLEKNGDNCKLKCNPGTYAIPASSFKCNESDYCTNSNIRCLAAKSCSEILQQFPKSQNEVYTIFTGDGTSSYGVYCDMMTDGGGWTLAAVVANGDGNNWAFGDNDRDFGDSNSLWENSVTLGKVGVRTSTTAADFKSRAFTDLAAKELMITFKGEKHNKILLDLIDLNDLIDLIDLSSDLSDLIDLRDLIHLIH